MQVDKRALSGRLRLAAFGSPEDDAPPPSHSLLGARSVPQPFSDPVAVAIKSEDGEEDMKGAGEQGQPPSQPPQLQSATVTVTRAAAVTFVLPAASDIKPDPDAQQHLVPGAAGALVVSEQTPLGYRMFSISNTYDDECTPSGLFTQVDCTVVCVRGDRCVHVEMDHYMLVYLHPSMLLHVHFAKSGACLQ
jgi:hypothetical protein